MRSAGCAHVAAGIGRSSCESYEERREQVLGGRGERRNNGGHQMTAPPAADADAAAAATAAAAVAVQFQQTLKHALHLFEYLGMCLPGPTFYSGAIKGVKFRL